VIDLIECFFRFYQAPRCGEVYNIGGGRFSNCSVLEGIRLCEEITGRKMKTMYMDDNRIGDHIWWISDVSKFQAHYPGWSHRFGLRRILEEICEDLSSRG